MASGFFKSLVDGYAATAGAKAEREADSKDKLSQLDYQRRAKLEEINLEQSLKQAAEAQRAKHAVEIYKQMNGQQSAIVSDQTAAALSTSSPETASAIAPEAMATSVDGDTSTTLPSPVPVVSNNIPSSAPTATPMSYQGVNEEQLATLRKQQAAFSMAGMDDMAQGVGQMIQAKQGELDTGIKREDLKIKQQAEARAATEAHIPTQQELNAQADQLGLPHVAYTPTKVVYEKGVQYGYEQAAKLEEEARTAEKSFDTLTRTYTVLQKLPTGPMTDQMLKLMQAAGLGAEGYQAAQAGISQLVPTEGRQGLPGAASENDVKMFRAALISTANTPADNAIIYKGLAQSSKNAAEFARFRKNMILTYGSAGESASNTEWNKYLASNPIFDPQSKTAVLNPNRQSWQEYFSGQKQSDTGSTQTTQQKQTFTKDSLFEGLGIK